MSVPDEGYSTHAYLWLDSISTLLKHSYDQHIIIDNETLYSIGLFDIYFYVNIYEYIIIRHW